MTPRSPSVGFRAVLAVGLMVGFYALALGLAGALLWVPYAVFNYAGRIPAKLALSCLAGAAIILWSVMPRRDRFEAPGPELEPAKHPKLFQMIRGVASATKQEMPADVYLVGDMNAWVAHRGGLMGLGARGIMGLGLPLLQTLTVSELRAVLAHEFGHYHGGDTKLGRFVHGTRTAIGRTLENLGHHGSILQFPFIWYGKLFLRVSHAVSRRQELAADRLAAHVVGARPLAEGLRKIHVAAPVFGYYWSNEVAPVLHAGFVPPLAAGFQRFVTGEIGQKALAAAREHSLKESEGDVFDTHPPLRERLQALEGCRPGDITGADPLAITLLADPQTLERAVVAPVLPSADGQHLPPIQWSEVGERVYQPLWQKEIDGAAAHCSPLAVEALGQQATRLSETLGAKLLSAAAPRELGARLGAGGCALARRVGHRCPAGRARHAEGAGRDTGPVRGGAGAGEGRDERGGVDEGVRAAGDHRDRDAGGRIGSAKGCPRGGACGRSPAGGGGLRHRAPDAAVLAVQGARGAAGGERRRAAAVPEMRNAAVGAGVAS